MKVKSHDYYLSRLIKYNVLNDGRTIQFIMKVHAKEDMESGNAGNHFWISEEYNMLNLFNTKDTEILDYENERNKAKEQLENSPKKVFYAERKNRDNNKSR